MDSVSIWWLKRYVTSNCQITVKIRSSLKCQTDSKWQKQLGKKKGSIALPSALTQMSIGCRLSCVGGSWAVPHTWILPAASELVTCNTRHQHRLPRKFHVHFGPRSVQVSWTWQEWLLFIFQGLWSATSCCILNNCPESKVKIMCSCVWV